MRMIERLIDWILIAVACFFAIATVLMMSYAAHADEGNHAAAYCAARVHLAQMILEGMRDGTPIENINVLFERQAPNPEMEKSREDWVQTLKAEIILERQTGGDEKAIAQRIAGRCNGQEVSAGRFIHAASSEAIAKKPDRTQECNEKLVDQIFIGNMLGSGRGTADELRTIAANTASAHGISEERLHTILPLIDEAEKAQKADKLQDWFNDWWHACLDGGK